MQDSSTSETKVLSSLTFSELEEERDRLLLSQKCTDKDLERIAEINQLLEDKKPMNLSKLKGWHWLVIGIAGGLLLTRGLPFNQGYQQVQQPQVVTPNAVTIPAGSGATVFNFDND